MKIFVMIICMLCLSVSVFAEPQELTSEKDRLSYSMGVVTGMQLKSQLQYQEVSIDIDLFAKGLKDAVNGSSLLVPEKDVQEIIAKFQKEIGAKQAEKFRQLAEKNKKEGAAYLDENKKKPGVKTLPSGLQYKVITEGKGKSPKESDTVTTHYRGTLIDGTEFDSSFKRNQPATFPLKGVIKGWIEALKLMKEGSKWMIYVPSELAYGESGVGAVGPNAVLIFEVELISVTGSAEKTDSKEQKGKSRK